MQTWKEKQRSWMQQRQLDFVDNHTQEENQDIVLDDKHEIPSYQIVKVQIRDNQFLFSGLGQGTLYLERNTTYVFDLSHPSNRGHHLMISRNPSSGSVKDLGIQGNSGKPGAFISFFIGSGRPKQLFYYCTQFKGMGGELQIPEV